MESNNMFKNNNDVNKLLSEALINDKYLQALHSHRIKIYSIAIPIIILKDDKIIITWEDDSNNNLVKNIEELIELRENQIKNFYKQ